MGSLRHENAVAVESPGLGVAIRSHIALGRPRGSVQNDALRACAAIVLLAVVDFRQGDSARIREENQRSGDGAAYSFAVSRHFEQQKFSDQAAPTIEAFGKAHKI